MNEGYCIHKANCTSTHQASDHRRKRDFPIMSISNIKLNVKITIHTDRRARKQTLTYCQQNFWRAIWQYVSKALKIQINNFELSNFTSLQEK